MKKRKVRRYSKSDRQNFLFVYLLIAIPVIQFIVFWIVVNATSIGYAFRDNKGFGDFTLKSFGYVFENMFHNQTPETNLLLMMGRSLLMWTVSYVIVFPISLLTTYVLFKKVCGHYVFRVIFSLAGIVGAVVWVSMMKTVYSGESQGIVVYILKSIGVELPRKVIDNGLLTHSQTAFPTLIAGSIIFGIAGGNVIVTGAYAKVPPELQEAAKLDGLDFWGTFFHVSLPCSWPTISTLITISMCSMLVVEGNVFLYFNGSAVNGTATMGYYLLKLTRDISANPVAADYSYASALGLIVTAVSIPLVLGTRKLLNKLIPTVEV